MHRLASLWCMSVALVVIGSCETCTGRPMYIRDNGIAAGAVLFANNSMIAGDASRFAWADAGSSLTITKPSSEGTLSTLLTLNADPSGAHGFGAHLSIAGNPGGGGTIFREDGGDNRSWLQIYGGGYSGIDGGQIYVNGNNCGDEGGCGGVQIVLGQQTDDPATTAPFQVFGPQPDYNTYLSVNAIGTKGQINIPSLTLSSAVITDSSSNLASSTTTATELGYVHGVTSSIQSQLNRALARPVAPHRRWVDFLSGSDAWPGTLEQPWQSLTHAYANITDASPTNQYTFLLSGSLVWTDPAPPAITGKPNINLFAEYGVEIISPFTITASSGGSDGLQITNIIFYRDFVYSTTNDAGTYLTLINVETLSGFTYTNSGTWGVFFTAEACNFGIFTLSGSESAVAEISTSIFSGTTVFGDSASAFYIFVGGFNAGSMSVAGNVQNAYFQGFIYAAGSSLTSVTTDNGQPVIEIDSASAPPTIAGSPSLVLNSLATYTAYTGSATFFTSPPPPTVQSALDSIASAVYALQGNVPIVTIV